MSAAGKDAAEKGSSFDPEPYAEGLRKANEAEAVARLERSSKARIEAQLLAQAIGRADPRIRRVFLFGSIAGGAPTRLDFDIDLAMDGGDLYAALDIADSSEFEIDLVELGRMPERTRRMIEEKGTLLYTRD